MKTLSVFAVALHPEGVDRNAHLQGASCTYLKSPSTRRAWIEIKQHCIYFTGYSVALHPEGVDRNNRALMFRKVDAVALHPEGVDRNMISGRRKNILKVALHPEGVDRNVCTRELTTHSLMSPSTRRAWIEIYPACKAFSTSLVALHPEGVDRNITWNADCTSGISSPSTRRAWIEISHLSGV